jgi:hypothetical protein
MTAAPIILTLLVLTFGQLLQPPVPPPRPPEEPVASLRLEVQARFADEPLSGLSVHLYRLGPGGRVLPPGLRLPLRISGDDGVVVFENLKVQRDYHIRLSHHGRGLRLELPLAEAFHPAASTGEIIVGRYEFTLTLE